MFYRYRYFIYAILLFPLVWLLLVIETYTNDTESIYELEKRFDKISRVYAKDSSHIYALVPSNGYYSLLNVAVKEFDLLSVADDDVQYIGKDCTNVYSGNLILEDLNPNTTTALGNDYFSDGVVSYNCSSNSEPNDNLNPIQETFELLGYAASINSKPQNYWYPFQRLEDNLQLKAVRGYALAVTADKVYYKGQEMPGANPKSIRPLFENDRIFLKYSWFIKF